MSDEPRNRVVRATYFGDYLRAGRIIEHAGVRHLPAGFGVNHSAVEHDFAGLTGLQFGDRANLCDNGLDASVLSTRGEIKIRLRLVGFRNLRERRIRRLLSRATLPRSACPRSLLLHGTLKTGFVELQAKIPHNILHKVRRKTECIVEFKS